MEMDFKRDAGKRSMGDDVDYEYKKFTRSAGGGHEKAIYFRCTSVWLVSDLCFANIKKSDSIMHTMPIRLQNLLHYSVVAWNSKIYFIGGERLDKINKLGRYSKVSIENLSTEVFAFDVENQMWDSDDSHPNMILPRVSSMAIAADAKIFVFGSYAPSFFGNNFEKYAEYYDIKRGKWFPIPEPPEMLCKTMLLKIRSAVVKNNILFWVYPLGCLYILNVNTMVWPTMEDYFGYPRPECHPFNRYPHPHLGPLWSNAVVAFYDALFWHHGGFIYAYDFKEKMNSVILLGDFENNTYFKDFEENNFYPWQVPATFLLSPVEGRLCLVWKAFYEKPNKYYCQNFQVERQDGKLGFQVGSCSTLASLPDFGSFRDVLVV